MRALAGLLFFKASDVTGPVVAAHTARSIPVELVVLAAGAQPISLFPGCHGGAKVGKLSGLISVA